MSAQEAEIYEDDNVVGTLRLDQGTLFSLPKVNEGAITLTSNRNIPLSHEQTAALMKDDEFGYGRTVVIKGGVGTIKSFGFKDGRMVWSVELEEVEVTL